MKKNVGVNIALVAVFAALIAAFALMPPLFAVGAVPFAIQLIPILLAPLVLGPWQGTLANLLYVVAGVAGLPVFSKQSSGIGPILGPTGGYIVGYVLAAALVGLITSLVLKRWVSGPAALVGLTGAAIAGVLVIHAAGVAGMMINVKLAFGKALAATTPFIPLDLAKALIAALIALAVVKAFPRLLALRG